MFPPINTVLFSDLKCNKLIKQAGTVLDQAQLKLELELYFTSFKIFCIKLVKLVKLGGATLLIIQNWTSND